MDTDSALTGSIQTQNGDISNMDTACSDTHIDNTDQALENSGAAKIISKDSKEAPGGVAIKCDPVGRSVEHDATMTNGVEVTDITESDRQAESVPKIFVCTEHCKTDCNVEDDNSDDTLVPSDCVSSSGCENPKNCSVEKSNASSKDKDCDGMRETGVNHSIENGQSEAVQNASNEKDKKSLNEEASVADCSLKSMEVEAETTKLGTDDSFDKNDQTQNEKENEMQAPHAEISPCPDDQQQAAIPHAKGSPSTSSSSASSSSSSQHSSSASASSKFSFFRSIQNILIATKWSKLRGPSKSHRHQNDGDEHDEDQEKQHLQKPEKRQRKISSKSQPGDLLRKQSQDDKDSDQEHSETSRGREGLEYLDNSRHSKDKGSSAAKHHFSLFKRHNNSSDSQQRPASPPNHPPAELTERQKALLRSSWAEIGDSVGQVGVITFIGLFETHPDVIDSFNQFRGMSLESVFSSISLKEHALRVMTTVEKFLNRIDRPDKLQKILEDLGKRHVGYRFKCEYIRIVGMQFICAMKPHVSSWTPETEQAWTALIDTMTFHMERGAIMEMQNTSNV